MAKTWIVDLGKFTYNCQEWYIVGIPCLHVVLYINHYCVHMKIRLDFSDYVYPELSNKAYCKTYS